MLLASALTYTFGLFWLLLWLVFGLFWLQLWLILLFVFDPCFWFLLFGFFSWPMLLAFPLGIWFCFCFGLSFWLTFFFAYFGSSFGLGFWLLLLAFAFGLFFWPMLLAYAYGPCFWPMVLALLGLCFCFWLMLVLGCSRLIGIMYWANSFWKYILSP